MLFLQVQICAKKKKIDMNISEQLKKTLSLELATFL